MKKTMLSLLLGILMYSAAYAQDGKPREPRLTPEQRTEQLIKDLEAKVELSQEDKDQLRAIMLESSTKLQSNREERKAIMEERKAKVAEVLSEEQLNALKEIRKEKHGERGMHRKHQPCENKH